MATITSRRLLTAEEFVSYTGDPSMRQELVEGVVIEMPPPGYRHGKIVLKLGRRLEDAAEQAAAGEVVAEVGFVLRRNPDTVRGPDLAFLSSARLPSADREDGYIEGAPDIAVEVLSPSNASAEIRRNVQEYLSAGARLVWVVDGRRHTVRVHRPDGSAQVLGEDDTLTGEDVLPGFAIRVGDLFR